MSINSWHLKSDQLKHTKEIPRRSKYVYLVGIKKPAKSDFKFRLVTRIYTDYFITDQNFQILLFFIVLWLKFRLVFITAEFFLPIGYTDANGMNLREGNRLHPCVRVGVLQFSHIFRGHYVSILHHRRTCSFLRCLRCCIKGRLNERKRFFSLTSVWKNTEPRKSAEFKSIG